MKVTNLWIKEGKPLGLPAEGSAAWVRLKAEAFRFHGGQSQYDAEKAANAARWLRDHPESWYDPDNELRRFDTWADYVEGFCELEPAWAEFLASYRGKLSGDYQTDRRTAAVALAEKAEPLAPPRRPTKEEQQERASKGSDTTLAGRGADYLTARIARDRPDILERMKAGEFRSVRQAAIEAGIVKVPTTLEKLRRLWAKATPEERDALRADLGAPQCLTCKGAVAGAQAGEA